MPVDNILADANISSVNEKIIKAICNENRVKLLMCLSKSPKTVTEMVSTCGLAQSAVSQHLVKLKNAGLVEDTKQGREVTYSIKKREVAEICNQISHL